MDDIGRLRDALAPVERKAQSLPWAKQRPWKTATHVGLDSAVPTIDLHDLGRAAAREAVDEALDLGDELDAGALFFVVGRGRHSVGGPVLPQVVGERLAERCANRGWTLRRPRAGRFAVVIDPTRAPPAATGALGWGFRLWLLFLALAAVLALARTCVPGSW